MKKLVSKSLMLLSVLLMSFSIYSQDFVISGNISDDEGNPVVQQEVVFSTSQGQQNDTTSFTSAFTDENGNYSANISVNGDSTLIFVETFAYACNQYYSDYVVANGQGSANVDFILCSDGSGNPSDCDLSFYYDYDYDNFSILHFAPFISDSAQGTTYSWSFGDGTGSNEEYPSHEYASPGEYIVTLNANNSQCGDMTYEDVVYVINEDSITVQECVADFYYELAQQNPYEITFTDDSYSSNGPDVMSWEWNFGDGEVSYEQNPVHLYNEDGQYAVSLTIMAGNCSATTEKYVSIGDSTWYPEECQALFYTEYNQNNFLTANFVDLSYSPSGVINGYQWEFGDGTGSAEQNPSHTYASEGEYMVTLTIYSQNCTSTFQEVVYMEDWGNGDDPCDGCQTFFYPEFDQTSLAVQFHDLTMPTPTSWAWNFGDGETSSEQNPYHEYSETGIYTVSLATASDTCNSEFAMEIELFEGNNGQKSGTSYSGIIRRAFAVHASGATKIDNVIENIYSIYPNPVNDKLNINLNKNIDVQISIITISGKVVKKVTSENKSVVEINTSNLPAGIYFVRVTSNGKTNTIKFVK